MSDVCAVLVNYRGAMDIVAAVDSVRRDSPGVDIVVVDNSVDAVEEECLRRCLPADVRLLVSPRNLGFGEGCNWAIQHTSANLIWLVNPDVRVLPGCLDALVDALDANPELAAVAPRQFLDKSRQWLLPPSWLPTAINTWVREKAARCLAARSRYVRAMRAEAVRFWMAPSGSVVVQRALSGAAILVRRSSLRADEAVFDPAYFMYFEDSDFCLRMRGRGLRLAVVVDAVAVHMWEMAPHKDGLMAAAAPLYFSRNFPGSRWLEKAAALTTLPPSWPEFVPVSDRRFQVPAELEKGWVLELSPSPLLFPAVAHFGQGPELEVDASVLAAFGNSGVFARLGPIEESVAEDQCIKLKF